MKYDILNQYKVFLNSKYKKSTAATYYSALESLLKDIPFDSVEEIPVSCFYGKLKALKTRAEIRKARSALKQFKACFDTFNLPDKQFFSRAQNNKPSKPLDKEEKIYIDSIRRKINQIKDKKLKLGFRLMLASAARVSEISALRKKDIVFTENGIMIAIENGKGGKSGTVNCLQDKYLADNLKRHLENYGNDEKVFYSRSHIINEAVNLGFECHDLRRSGAQIFRKEQIAKGKTKKQADKQVQEMLRHSSIKTTDAYLFRKRIVEVNKK